MANQFLNIEIVQVEPDTVIENDGVKEVVTDTNVVFVGRKMFVTPIVFEKIKTQPRPE